MKTESTNGMQVLKRRSSRMALKARITLSGDDRTSCAFTMPANATKLNRHGAAIQLNRELLVSSTIVLQTLGALNFRPESSRRSAHNVRVSILTESSFSKPTPWKRISGESTFRHLRLRSEDADCLGQLA